MALRNLIRRPVRAAMTAFGTALSVALLVTAMFPYDSIDGMIDNVFFRENRQDATLLFATDSDPAVVADIASWNGVLKAEPLRATSVELRNGRRSERLAIDGVAADSDLVQRIDADGAPLAMPPTGLVLSDRVAAKLVVGMGDMLEVTLLDAGDRVVQLPVTGLSSSFIGEAVAMRLDALDRLLPDGPRVNGVNVLLDEDFLPQLYEQVKQTPVIPALALMTVGLQQFRKTIDENISISAGIFVTLAVVITFGVVYNAARIQLSEGARELASLRVFGFTRAEVSSVLIIELALLVLIAQPVGWVMGRGLSWLIVQAFASDLFRIPLTTRPATLAIASLVVIGAAAFSLLLVRRRIDRLDLVAVLKTRE